MSQLQCNAANCASNKENHCCQPAIKVQGKSATTPTATRCQSFMQKGAGELSNSVQYSGGNTDCEVRCTACHCSHNKAGSCNADSVNIDGCNACDKSDTCCNSFITQ